MLCFSLCLFFIMSHEQTQSNRVYYFLVLIYSIYPKNPDFGIFSFMILTGDIETSSGPRYRPI